MEISRNFKFKNSRKGNKRIMKKIINDTIKGEFSGLRQNLATESPLKMMKNAFHFTLKSLFVLKIFKFCLDFLVM